MSTQFLTVSPSPHIHSEDSVQKLMYGVIIAMLPALAISFFVFGIGAIYVTLLSVVSCVVVEFALTKYVIKKEPSIIDGSAIITGILLAFNVPSSLPWWTIILGSIVAIGIGKTAFGGLGNNPFNPALVGRVFFADFFSSADDKLAGALRIEISIFGCYHRSDTTCHYQRRNRCRHTCF